MDSSADLESFQKISKDYEALPFNEGEEAVWNEAKANWKNFVEAGLKIVELSKHANKAEFKERDAFGEKTYHPLFKAQEVFFQKLLDINVNASVDQEKEANASLSHFFQFLFALILTSFIIAMSVAVYISNSLSKTLVKMADDLSRGATNVAEAATNISEASNSLSSSTTEQASSLQETAASIEEINAMISKNASNALKSQELAESSRSTATEGHEAVRQMIRDIEMIGDSNNRIAQEIETSNQDISNIVKVIAEIGNKTKIINDIVFQTKLLSFNASVEAARAGEHGKGFAVVAEEIGTLAQVSGTAAKEISEMLEASIQKVESVVKNTSEKVTGLVKQGIQNVQAGSNTAKRCEDALNEIVSNTNTVKAMVDEISQASQEQSQGVQEITKAMAQLDEVTQQNSATSNQTAGSSENLSDQAEKLRNVVNQLFVTVTGKVGNVQTSHPATTKRANVIPLTAATKAKKTHERVTKKAAGAENLPSYDDGRFEEV